MAPEAGNIPWAVGLGSKSSVMQWLQPQLILLLPMLSLSLLISHSLMLSP